MTLEVGALGDRRTFIAFKSLLLELKSEFLEAENVELKWTAVDSAASVSLVQAGQLPLLFNGSYTQAVLLHSKAAKNVVAVGAALQGTAYVMGAGPKVTRLQDLKGGVIAVTSLVSAGADATRIMMKAAGMLPDRDYTMLAVGSTAGVGVEAVKAGKVQAVCDLPTLFYQSVADGSLHLVAKSADYIPAYFGGTLLANAPWLKQNGDVVVRILRAGLRLGKWMFDPANRDEIVAIAAKELKLTPAFARQFYDDAIASGVTSPDYFAPKSSIDVLVQAMIDTDQIKAADVPPISETVDWSYLQEAHTQLGLTMRGPLY